MGAMVRVVLDSRVRIYDAPGKVREDLRHKFTHGNPSYGRATRYGAAPPKGMLMEYETWAVDADGAFSIPRGGVVRMRAIFEKHGIAYEVEDRRENGLALAWSYTLKRKPWDHQQAVIDLVRVEQALVRAPTGSGKTMAALGFIIGAKRWALVVVPTSALMLQWARSAMDEVVGLSKADIGFVGNGKHDLRPITIATPQSFGKLTPDELCMFGTFVFDEVHRAAATSFQQSVDESPQRYRLGVSADERRKDRKEFLVRDMFGAAAVDISREDLIRKGVVLDVQIHMIPTAYESSWYVLMQERAKAAREHLDSGKKLSAKLRKKLTREEEEAFTKLVAEMVEDEERNALAVQVAVAGMKNGNSLLVFTHRREHAERLRAGISASDARVGLMLGGKPDEKEFEACRAALVDGRYRAGVGTYQSMGTGIDLPAVDRGVAATPIHTNRGIGGQVRGRLCRVGSKDAVLWYLWDERVFGDAPVKAIMKWNKATYVLSRGRLVPGKEYLAAAVERG